MCADSHLGEVSQATLRDRHGEQVWPVLNFCFLLRRFGSRARTTAAAISLVTRKAIWRTKGSTPRWWRATSTLRTPAPGSSDSLREPTLRRQTEVSLLRPTPRKCVYDVTSVGQRSSPWDTERIRFSAVRSPRFWVSGYCTKWRIQVRFSVCLSI